MVKWSLHESETLAPPEPPPLQKKRKTKLISRVKVVSLAAQWKQAARASKATGTHRTEQKIIGRMGQPPGELLTIFCAGWYSSKVRGRWEEVRITRLRPI